jgi:hypothetical protein
MFEVKLKTDLKDVEKLSKEYPEASKKARTSKLTEAVNLLEAAVKKGTPYGAGPIHLRDTVHSSVKASGERIVGMVGTPAKYGESVELGTKAHFPPVGPLQFWVEKKLGYSGAEAASVAFLIARAISVRGTKGAKMFETGFEDQEARVMAILNEIPDDIVRRVSG